MTTTTAQVSLDVESRARQSDGASNEDIYQMVADCLREQHCGGGTLLDVGCGTGRLWSFVSANMDRYIGVDAVRYADFADACEFHLANVDNGKIALADEFADVVAAVETIEHLENPRAFMRELVRLARTGGIVLVTTPNQLSALSLLTLVIKKRFSAFQDVHYPTHLTALLEIDLRRIATEAGLREISFRYSLGGRLVLTPWHYPKSLARLFPRALSDNVLMIGRKPK